MNRTEPVPLCCLERVLQRGQANFASLRSQTLVSLGCNQADTKIELFSDRGNRCTVQFRRNDNDDPRAQNSMTTKQGLQMTDLPACMRAVASPIKRLVGIFCGTSIHARAASIWLHQSQRYGILGYDLDRYFSLDFFHFENQEAKLGSRQPAATRQMRKWAVKAFPRAQVL